MVLENTSVNPNVPSRRLLLHIDASGQHVCARTSGGLNGLSSA